MMKSVVRFGPALVILGGAIGLAGRASAGGVAPLWWILRGASSAVIGGAEVYRMRLARK